MRNVRVVDVRPDERRTTFAAFFTLLGITSGHTMLETARDALFLAKIPASHLPWMYLVIVVVALGLAQIPRAGIRTDGKVGIAAVLLGAAAVTAGFWGLAAAPSPALLYALYVWTGVFASWVTVQFWTLLGRAHTMQQAKRLYGFIGAGAVLGGVLGAVASRAAMAVFAPRTSLLVAAAIFVLAAGPCLAVRLPAPAEPAGAFGVGGDAGAGSPARAAPMRAGLAMLWQNAFARRVLGIVLVSTVTVTVADYVFKAVVASEIRDASQLGAVFATFYAVTNTIGLVAQLVVAPWVFRSLGVQRALFFFPAAVALAAGGVVGAAATGGLLVAVVLLKGVDGVTRYSLHRTSMELLLVPVPDLVRERIKPLVDLLGSRGGQALASVGILFLVMVGSASPKVLGAIVLTLAVVWLSLVVTIRGLYLDVFRETLRSGGLSGKAELPELDLGMLEALFAGLNSSRDGEVLASLELLAEQHRERLIPALILYHPSREVVLRSLEIFAHMGRTDFVPIADRLDAHPDREVAAAALRARTAVAPDREILRERLGSPCMQVGATALVALMARGWIEPDEAEAKLRATFEARSAETVAELARAIRDVAGERGDGPFEDLFDELLIRISEKASSVVHAPCAAEDDRPVHAGRPIQDAPDVSVRLEVARAMAARKSAKFLPALVEMLARHEIRATARDALRGIPGALEALHDAMRSAQTRRGVRMQLPRAMTVFEPAAAAPILLEQLLVQPDGAVRYRILMALVKLRRSRPHLPLDRARLEKAISVILDHAEELRRWGDALSGTGGDKPPASAVSGDPLRAAHHLLVDLVHDKELHATQRLLMLFDLLYDEDFEDVWRGLRSTPKKRASSIELLENLIRAPFRDRFLALVERGRSRAGASRRTAAAAEREREPELAYEQAIREIVARAGSTMRTLAEYRAVELGLDVTDVARARTSDASALAASLGQRFVERARGLLPDAPLPGGARHAPS